MTVSAVLTSCNNAGQNKAHSNIDSVTNYQNRLTNNQNDNSEIIEINCDSIFKDKGIKIKLISLDTNKVSEPNYKYIFLFSKQQNGKYFELFRDTIESTVQEVKFADFNNDNIKDILIQNISDVRSNWTFNLYLVDSKQDKIIKVKGFNEIKNPKYLPAYNLVDNYVNSGTNWTSFFKIQGDTVIDLGIEIDDNQTEDGTYQKEYKKAINKILKNEKNNR